MKKFCVLSILSGLSSVCLGQSSLFFRNNTNFDYRVETQVTSNHSQLDTNWTWVQDTVLAWNEDDTEVLRCQRNASYFQPGDTLRLSTRFISVEDTVQVDFLVVGNSNGSDLLYRVAGPGYDEGWLADGNFHQSTLSLNNQACTLIYKPDNDDSAMGRSLRVSTHDNPIYTIEQADFDNPNVLNLMSYNVQMITFAVSGLGDAALRSDLLPAHFSPYQDVVTFQEIFDDSPREDHMVPAMEAQGFIYHTTILNDPGLIPFPINGGVMLFSKWPILDSDEIEYSLCGQSSSDCLARKGVKYAKINKLGKNYHIFATHMDAGSDADDWAARHSQVDEINNFIQSRNIPTWEPVIFGGDLNTRPYGEDGVFQHFEDSIGFIYPNQTGFYESNFSMDTGRFIDHIWINSHYLLPMSAETKSITFTSIEPSMWDLSHFSDHRSIVGRFEFPDVGFSAFMDASLCPGDSFSGFVSSSNNPGYEWSVNGVPLNLLGGNLDLYDLQSSASGTYACHLIFDVSYADSSHYLNLFFYPNGPRTYASETLIPIVDLDVDSSYCPAGLNNLTWDGLSIFPNPNQGSFEIKSQTRLNGKLRLIDLQGKVCYEEELEALSTKQFITNQKPGLYLLQVVGEGKSYYQKILIE
jgi:endonuclease/exonuclease/phosphatase family metal-dependent hydrolase